MQLVSPRFTTDETIIIRDGKPLMGLKGQKGSNGITQSFKYLFSLEGDPLCVTKYYFILFAYVLEVYLVCYMGPRYMFLNQECYIWVTSDFLYLSYILKGFYLL